MRLPEALQQAALQHPNKTALSYKAASINFQDLYRQSDWLAAHICAQGVKPGECVGVLADPGIEAVLIFWAVLKAGAIVVNLNEHLQPQGLADILRDCGLKRVFSSEKYADERLAITDLPLTVNIIENDLAAMLQPADTAVLPTEQSLSERDIAAIVYTSGSTGKPKGVCLSHSGLLLAAQADSEQMQITDKDSYLMLVPLHYVHGLLELIIHQINAATLYFAGSFLFPRTIIKQLQQTAVTGFSGVPFHFIALLDRAGFAEAELPHLRWCAVTGGRFPVERIEQICAAKPGLDVYITYGQTECSPRITLLDARKLTQKPGSVGAPPAGIAVAIVSDTGETLAQGETGEVVVKGDNVMLGYWRDPEATAKVIDQNGWLHTGDLGYFDAEGDLFLVGRKQAMIKSAGERIFPEEIEQVILSHPQVAEAAVIGLPDSLYGQRIEAYIELTPASQSTTDFADEIRSHCLARMPFARAPKAYHVLASLPRKANGKVDKQALLTASPACVKQSVKQGTSK